MENIEERPFEEPVKLIVTEDIRSYIYDTTKWTRFLSIVGFVGSALCAISAVSIGSVMNSASALQGGGMGMFGAMGSTFMTVFMLLYALIIFYPSLLLFKYSNAAQQAILYGDQAALSVSAAKMKSYFKFMGILIIIGIAFYIIAILLFLTKLG